MGESESIIPFNRSTAWELFLFAHFFVGFGIQLMVFSLIPIFPVLLWFTLQISVGSLLPPSFIPMFLFYSIITAMLSYGVISMWDKSQPVRPLATFFTGILTFSVSCVSCLLYFPFIILAIQSRLLDATIPILVVPFFLGSLFSGLLSFRIFDWVHLRF